MLNSRTNAPGYNISNEYDSIVAAYKYFKKLECEYVAHAFEHHKKSIWYKIEKYIFRQTVDNINILDYPNYYFKLKYKGYSHFKIECSLIDLEQWKTAIERKNEFTISSVDYSHFLEYVKASTES